MVNTFDSDSEVKGSSPLESSQEDRRGSFHNGVKGSQDESTLPFYILLDSVMATHQILALEEEILYVGSSPTRVTKTIRSHRDGCHSPNKDN